MFNCLGTRVNGGIGQARFKGCKNIYKRSHGIRGLFGILTDLFRECCQFAPDGVPGGIRDILISEHGKPFIQGLEALTLIFIHVTVTR